MIEQIYLKSARSIEVVLRGRVIFFGSLEQSFSKALLSLNYEGTSLTTGKVCRRPVCFERIICIYRRTEVQNKTIARETDKYSSGMGTEFERFLKAN